MSGNIGDAFALLMIAPQETYIEAVATKINTTQVQIIIPGDYPEDVQTFNAMNLRTGNIEETTFDNSVVSLQNASYLGEFDANDNKAKQITVLHDLQTNDDNVIFASVDFSNDGTYNWVRIGGYSNGVDGKSIYSVSSSTASTIFANVKIGDSVVVASTFTYQSFPFDVIGDVYIVNTVTPLGLTKTGNIRGPQGATGETGETGAAGADGETPTIQNGYWYIGSTNTGVKAIGEDGADGQNGQSFQMKSGLYSTPSNYGETGNIGPNSEVLQQLPTLPQTSGLTGYAYVVYDPLTTPLEPYYDLYYANDNDVSWTILHPFSGLKGQDGSNGYTPYIQDNQWYINGVSTGVQATGNTGATGATGKGFYNVSSDVSNISTVTGSRVGDFIVNAGSTSLTILGTTAAIGDVVEITGDTTGSKVGNIRGPQGSTGNTGPTGATPSISVTATQLSSSSQPTATVSGTDDNPIITFGIPAGEQGPAGPQGIPGASKPTAKTYSTLIPHITNQYWEVVEQAAPAGTTFADVSCLWTDGDNVYYSLGGTNLVLNKTTNEWEAKTWNGLTNINGESIWTDGYDVYYSRSSNQYVLNKATSTWTAKTWTGTTSNPDGRYIWTDGQKIYLSNSTTAQYVLNTATSAWENKTWTLAEDQALYGTAVWTDGYNIYCSNNSGDFILDKSTSTWSRAPWAGDGVLIGSVQYLFTDGANIYFEQFPYTPRVFDPGTMSWSTIPTSSISGPGSPTSSFGAKKTWTDGDYIYNGLPSVSNNVMYVSRLKKQIKATKPKGKFSGIVPTY